MDLNLFKDMTAAVQAAIKQQARTAPYDTPGTVTRIEGDTAWVHFPGGVDETPVRLTIAAKPGDEVQVRVGGGSAWLVGNGTAPPTDDTTAKAAEKKAEEASGVAKNFVTDTKDGIFVHPKNNTADGVRITDSIEIIKSKLSYFRVWIEGAIAKVRVGREDQGHTLIDSGGMRVYGGDGTERLCNIGYGEGINQGGSVAVAPYFEMGSRAANTDIGNWSMLEGGGNEASGAYSHVEGRNCAAKEYGSHAGGMSCKADGLGAFAHGRGLKANGDAQAVFGKNNSPNSHAVFQVGCGGFAYGATGEMPQNCNGMELMQNGCLNVYGTIKTGLSFTDKADFKSKIPDGANQILEALTPYLFVGQKAWSQTVLSDQSKTGRSWGICFAYSGSTVHCLFMYGGSLYKTIYTLGTDSFATTQIG